MTQLGRIATEERDHVTIASLGGEFDMSNADEVRRQISDAAARHTARRLVVDLSEVTFLDSSTVHLLLGLRDASHERNIALRIVAPAGSRAARVLEMAGAGTAVTLSGSLEEAIGQD